MTAKPSYSELEHKIKQLEKKALEYVRKEKEFTAEENWLTTAT